MTKSWLLAIALVACGGKSKPAPAPDTTETAKPDEAKPDEAKPDEAKTEAKAEPKEKEPDPAAIAQAALAEQLEAGKKVFTEKKCATCHGDAGAGDKKNPPVIGEKAFPEKAGKAAKLRKKVTFKTAKDVHDFVKAKMPLKAPGTLTDDEAAAVTAWLLTESKITIDKKLDASNAGDVKLR